MFARCTRAERKICVFNTNFDYFNQLLSNSRFICKQYYRKEETHRDDTLEIRTTKIPRYERKNVLLPIT